MTLTWEFMTFLTCTAMTAVFRANAESLPSPSNLSYKWLDPFIVNVSWAWEEPWNLPKGCVVKFEFKAEDVRRTEHKHFIVSCFPKESDNCSYNIHATFPTPCDGWNDSRFVEATVQTPKPRAQMVTDFKCFLDPSGINCSWIPVHRPSDLTLSYRLCGQTSEELIKSLKQCDRYYTSGARDGCYLEVGYDTDICILVANETKCITFKALIVVHPPQLTIESKESNLHLRWPLPVVKSACVWKYELCSVRCVNIKECKNITFNVGVAHSTKMSYDENCRYEFRSRIFTDKTCPPISSDFGDIVTHGINKPPDDTLTVVAFIIPIVLSVCVILSCYCFRRNHHIICPTIPDPSAIFKEMMMNGNKDLKPTTENLYMPEPEPTESCRIALVKENSVSQQNV